MFTSMNGRSVVVTGGSRGIGRGIARVFAGAGAKVLVCGRDLSACQDAVDEFVAAGGEASAYITGQSLVIDGGQVLPESLQALQEM